MARQKPAKTYDSALQYFRAHGYDVREVPEVANQVEVRKHNCAAVLARTADGGVQYVAGPGCLIGGKIATLVDRGFQKFFVAGELTIAATADRLRQLHDFQEETSLAAGHPDYYNLSLGTVSDVYLYDRVRGREPATSAH
jgi:hypothetical protein